MKKSWTVQSSDGTRVVEVERGLLSNKRTIRVDGQVVEQGQFSAFDFGGDYPFQLGPANGRAAQPDELAQLCV